MPGTRHPAVQIGRPRAREHRAVNARANTCTTGAGSGIGIYWLNGSKVADSYSDLYDGSWDNGGSGRNEHGNARTGTDVWTGTNGDGTTGAGPFGENLVTFGDPE